MIVSASILLIIKSFPTAIKIYSYISLGIRIRVLYNPFTKSRIHKELTGSFTLVSPDLIVFLQIKLTTFFV